MSRHTYTSRLVESSQFSTHPPSIVYIYIYYDMYVYIYIHIMYVYIYTYIIHIMYMCIYIYIVYTLYIYMHIVYIYTHRMTYILYSTVNVATCSTQGWWSIWIGLSHSKFEQDVEDHPIWQTVIKQPLWCRLNEQR